MATGERMVGRMEGEYEGDAASIRADTPMTTLDDDDGGGGGGRKSRASSAMAPALHRSKADSLHDLRRSAVSSVLRLPPSTPPSRRRHRVDQRCPSHSRPASRAKSYCAVTSGGSHRFSRSPAPGGLPGGDDEFAAIFGIGGPRGRRYSRHHLAVPPPHCLATASTAIVPRPPPLLERLLRWPPQLIAVTPTLSDDEDEVERRESYALDEVDSFKVVPKAKNKNHHKRVSL